MKGEKAGSFKKQFLKVKVEKCVWIFSQGSKTLTVIESFVKENVSFLQVWK